MSFAEFTYQLLQGYDFCHLYREHGCTLQLGGSDQWGNMLAGVEMIERMLGEGGRDSGASARPPVAVTFPLLTTSSGEKMGKSSSNGGGDGGAVWLDGSLTQPFDLYQYFMKMSDEDARRLLPILTFLPLAAVERLLAEHERGAAERPLQRRLALEVTDLVHGSMRPPSLAKPS